MVKLIVAAVILIIIMLVFVFILFKNIIKRIDENAKKYFVNKMQSYDYILVEKQMKLEEIKNEIEEVKSENKNILKAKEGYEESDDSYMFEKNERTKNNEEQESSEDNRNQLKYNLKEPEYRDTQFFNNYKEIKKIFTVNNEQIIRDFIEKHKNAKEEKEYRVLKKIKEQFNDEAVYGCLTLSIDSQKELLKEVLKEQEKKVINLDKLLKKETFNIKDLIKYIDERMEQIEPTIYIYM